MCVLLENGSHENRGTQYTITTRNEPSSRTLVSGSVLRQASYKNCWHQKLDANLSSFNPWTDLYGKVAYIIYNIYPSFLLYSAHAMFYLQWCFSDPWKSSITCNGAHVTYLWPIKTNVAMPHWTNFLWKCGWLKNSLKLMFVGSCGELFRVLNSLP